MTVRLNQRAYDHARDLIAAGRSVIDDRAAWRKHQPLARQENEFIERHGTCVRSESALSGSVLGALWRVRA